MCFAQCTRSDAGMPSQIMHCAVPRHEVPAAINGMVVGLAASGAPQGAPPAHEHVMSALAAASGPPLLECLGLAIVRAVDEAEGQVYVLSPITDAQLQRVDTLQVTHAIIHKCGQEAVEEWKWRNGAGHMFSQKLWTRSFSNKLHVLKPLHLRRTTPVLCMHLEAHIGPKGAPSIADSADSAAQGCLYGEVQVDLTKVDTLRADAARAGGAAAPAAGAAAGGGAAGAALGAVLPHRRRQRHSLHEEPRQPAARQAGLTAACCSRGTDI